MDETEYTWGGVDIGAAIRENLATMEAHRRLSCRFCGAPPSRVTIVIDPHGNLHRECIRCTEVQP